MVNYLKGAVIFKTGTGVEEFLEGCKIFLHRFIGVPNILVKSQNI